MNLTSLTSNPEVLALNGFEKSHATLVHCLGLQVMTELRYTCSPQNIWQNTFDKMNWTTFVEQFFMCSSQLDIWR